MQNQSPFPDIVKFELREKRIPNQLYGLCQAVSPYMELEYCFNDNTSLYSLSENLDIFRAYASKQITEPRYFDWEIGCEAAYLNIDNEKVVIMPYENEWDNPNPILEIPIQHWVLIYEAWYELNKEVTGMNPYILDLMQEPDENAALEKANQTFQKNEPGLYQYFLFVFEPKVLTWLSPLLPRLALHFSNWRFYNFANELKDRHSVVEGITTAVDSVKSIISSYFFERGVQFAQRLIDKIDSLTELARQRPLLAREQYERDTLVKIIAVASPDNVYFFNQSITKQAIDPELKKRLLALLEEKKELYNRFQPS